MSLLISFFFICSTTFYDSFLMSMEKPVSLSSFITEFKKNESFLSEQEKQARQKTINFQDENGDTPLMLATRNGNLPLVKFLKNQGGDIHASGLDGCTLLHEAAYYGHSDIVEYLLEQGVFFDAVMADDITPLQLATIENKPRCVEILLQAGASLARLNKHGISVFHSAAYKGYHHLLTLFMRHASFKKKFLEHKTKLSESTPLHRAVEGNWLSTVQLLLLQGANVHAHTIDGKTPFFIAMEQKNFDSAELLLMHGARINDKAYNGDTPWHVVSDAEPLKLKNFLIHTLCNNSKIAEPEKVMHEFINSEDDKNQQMKIIQRLIEADDIILQQFLSMERNKALFVECNVKRHLNLLKNIASLYNSAYQTPSKRAALQSFLGVSALLDPTQIESNFKAELVAYYQNKFK